MCFTTATDSVTGLIYLTRFGRFPLSTSRKPFQLLAAVSGRNLHSRYIYNNETQIV